MASVEAKGRRQNACSQSVLGGKREAVATEVLGLNRVCKTKASEPEEKEKGT